MRVHVCARAMARRRCEGAERPCMGDVAGKAKGMGRLGWLVGRGGRGLCTALRCAAPAGCAGLAWAARHPFCTLVPSCAVLCWACRWMTWRP